MAGNSTFEMVGERGWRRGLGNLMGAGFAGWWKSNTWWIFALIWTGVTVALMAGIMWSASDAEPGEGILILCFTTGAIAVVAVIIIMMDEIVGEVQSGAAAWILSKPVSRQAFILGKLVPNAVSVPVTMVIIPGLVAYGLLLLADIAVAPLGLLLAMGVLSLNLWFYLTLTLMLGTLFNNRGAVIAIPLALAFGQQLILGLSPLLVKILPWTLALPHDDEHPSIAASLLQGQAPHSLMPIAVAAGCCVLFVAIALWRFEQREL